MKLGDLSSQTLGDILGGQRATAMRAPSGENPIPATLRDGRQRIVHVEAEPEFNEHGHSAGYTGIVQDVTDRRADEDRIRHLANFDSLTGLPNRRQLVWRMERAIEHARRSQFAQPRRQVVIVRNADMPEIDREREIGASRMIDAGKSSVRNDVQALLTAIIRMRAPADIGEQRSLGSRNKSFGAVQSDDVAGDAFGIPVVSLSFKRLQSMTVEGFLPDFARFSMTRYAKF